MTTSTQRFTVIALIDGLWNIVHTTTDQSDANEVNEEFVQWDTVTDVIATEDNDKAVWESLDTLNGGVEILED